jgi:hypothetical protein
MLEIQGHRSIVKLRSRPLGHSPIESLVFHRPKLLRRHFQAYNVYIGIKKPFLSPNRFSVVDFKPEYLAETNKVYYDLPLPLRMTNGP